ncbi:hypothetical protein AGABI2DRAFT_142292 [Agaricus bisporus var. bisporus H97]|uniref:hypothetical protein n=1 Tax=Agaricus bisporus var. bisporus (strain H97 / ATCC MYA-4626 / FGSC 10389) TaxID=936046 RepID=UPI00029F629E|nr:hypothetical protein AGABI2DRAFT_142292 [Agaricus bisporus var. bisporus H97]EKV48030.1 hypothetical protein AGABI2DRAFT_142292 [Agaricus bisporus var. bisporus H97]
MSLSSTNEAASAVHVLSLQNYVQIAGFVFTFYDHVITFDQEIELIWATGTHMANGQEIRIIEQLLSNEQLSCGNANERGDGRGFHMDFTIYPAIARPSLVPKTFYTKVKSYLTAVSWGISLHFHRGSVL